jgi:hypothetical protein
LKIYKEAEVYAKENKLGMWEFIDSGLENKLFDKYNKEIKQDLEFNDLEEQLKIKFVQLEQEAVISNEYTDLIEEIDLLYLNKSLDIISTDNNKS